MTEQPKAPETPVTPATPVQPSTTPPAETPKDKPETPAQPEGSEETILGKKAEDGTEGKETPKSAAPEKYDIKPPEGFNIDETAMNTMSPVFQKHGLSNEAVQEIINTYAPLIKAQMDASNNENMKVFKEVVDEWKADTKKLLGADYDKKVSIASKAINKSKVEGLREVLNETGVGNHPAMIQFMIWAGNLIKEDTMPEGPSAPGTQGGINMDAMYPSMKK